jgi:hypothetical protein
VTPTNIVDRVKLQRGDGTAFGPASQVAGQIRATWAAAGARPGRCRRVSRCRRDADVPLSLIGHIVLVQFAPASHRDLGRSLYLRSEIRAQLRALTPHGASITANSTGHASPVGGRATGASWSLPTNRLGLGRSRPHWAWRRSCKNRMRMVRGFRSRAWKTKLSSRAGLGRGACGTGIGASAAHSNKNSCEV